jgi:hypothetical protein
MATKKKLLQAAAGSAGGAGGLNVEDVFSTYLYEGFGTSTDKQIVNGVNLADEGGMVWIKSRTTTQDNTIFDTERGVHGYIVTNKTDAQYTPSGDRGLQSYNTDGFTIPDTSYFGGFDQASSDLVSWTFRKAPKFFDVIKVVGDGTGTRTISHNLNGTVGTIIIKKTSGTGDWFVSHRTQNNFAGWGKLNTTDAFSSTGSQISNVTNTSFDIGSFYNGNGVEWIIYVFAHNDDDGEFGPDGDADIIKCGSYTGTSSSPGAEVDLGFEPQFVMIKRATGGTGPWIMLDNMRGIVTGGNDAPLQAESSNAEGTDNRIFLTPTGFRIEVTSSFTNNSGDTYIYIAIRRGPMAVPTDATDVFGATNANEPSTSELQSQSGVLADIVLHKPRIASSGHNWFLSSRLLGANNYLMTDSTSAESSVTTFWQFDNNEYSYIPASGYYNNAGGAGQEQINYSWKRAPNFFDVVAYTGNGTAGRTVSHNLGVAPEMMWVKRRDSGASWRVYHKDLGATNYLILDTTQASTAATVIWNDTAPTSEVFSVGSASSMNASGGTYIAYLFASLDGVSKVGSYTGNATGTNATNTQNIECGFAPRFVLVKATSTTGQWAVWDTERGIVAGDDSTLYLDSTVAEDVYDFIDPYSTGFTITNLYGNYNNSGVSYIFYAVA